MFGPRGTPLCASNLARRYSQPLKEHSPKPCSRDNFLMIHCWVRCRCTAGKLRDAPCCRDDHSRCTPATHFLHLSLGCYSNMRYLGATSPLVIQRDENINKTIVLKTLTLALQNAIPSGL
eukprot:jgi/Botrbrau1/23647/Bobra.55_2s0033.1